LSFGAAVGFRNNTATIIKLKLDGPARAIAPFSIEPVAKTVNPDASQKTRELLEYLYSISGKKTLTGQHYFIGRMSKSTDRVAELTGKYPALWGNDFALPTQRGIMIT